MALLSFSTWLKANFSRSRFARRASRRVRRPPGPRFLRLESLESRTLLSASTFMVNNLHDHGSGSLRAAIVGANAHGGTDVIYFANNLQGTIKLTSGALGIAAENLTIEGPGENQLTVSGDKASRVFDIGGSASVSIAGLTITEGRANAGGGILIEDSASLQHQQLQSEQQRGPGHRGRRRLRRRHRGLLVQYADRQQQHLQRQQGRRRRPQRYHR